MPHKKGHTNNPHGRPKGIRSKKMEQWDKLGDFITKEGAERAMEILGDLDDETYLDQYNKLLNYFKPRLQSATLKAETDVYVKLVHPDDDLMDKI